MRTRRVGDGQSDHRRSHSHSWCFTPRRFLYSAIRMNLRRRWSIICIFCCGLLCWWLFTYVGRQEHQAKDDRIGEEMLMRYRPPRQAKVDMSGRRMDLDSELWKRVLRDHAHFTSVLAKRLTKDSVQKFVVVTAGSSSYYGNCLKAIASAQETFPDHQVYFYDLENDVDVQAQRSLKNKIESLCAVKYRHFNFSQYPPHVKNLKFYAWKPLIIFEMLKEYPGVLWIDSSIRFTTHNFTAIFHKAVLNGGMLALTSAGHSNFAVTHQHTYLFLPTSMKGMVDTDQHEANCLLLYRTRVAFENVLWWWMLCALDRLCIAPIEETGCSDPYRSRKSFAHCHRFDQSALNILLANHFVFDHKEYIGPHNVAEVNRFSSDAENVIVCSADGKVERIDTIEYMAGGGKKATKADSVTGKSTPNRPIQTSGFGALRRVVAPSTVGQPLLRKPGYVT